MSKLTSTVALLMAGAAPAEFSLSQLVDAYNEAVQQLERPYDTVKSFRDKPSAERRVAGVVGELKVEAKIAADKAKAAPKAKAAKAAKPVRARKVKGEAAAGAATTDDRVIKLVAKADVEFRGQRATLFGLIHDGITAEEYIAAAVAAGVDRHRARFELRHMRNMGAVKF